MAKPVHRQEIITFKADPSLLDALKGIANRSEFIRTAVLAALDSVCPLCRGTGILKPHQKNHWQEFAADHSLSECDDCHELYLVCGKAGPVRAARRTPRRSPPQRKTASPP